jgi:hypothetical protein
MKDLLHVAVGDGAGLVRATAVLTRTQVGRIPVLPVVLGVRLLIVVVVLRRLAEELRKHRDVHGSCSFQRPGSRSLISCSSQPLPSGSLNEAYEA